MNELKLNQETMTSTQLSELLGKSKSHVNESIRSMFQKEIDDRKITSSLDTRGYVIDYLLPEVESKMYVASKDTNYLRKITQYWIDRNIVLSPAEQLLANAQLLVDHERKIKEIEYQQHETNCQVKALVDGEDYFTIVGYANITHRKVDRKEASKLGKQVSKICTDNDWMRGEASHPVYGICYTYPREALEIIFEDKCIKLTNKE